MLVDEDAGRPAHLASLDQIGAILRDEASLAATYWRALRGRQVPWLLAAVLVRDWHASFRELQLQQQIADDEE